MIIFIYFKILFYNVSYVYHSISVLHTSWMIPREVDPV